MRFSPDNTQAVCSVSHFTKKIIMGYTMIAAIRIRGRVDVRTKINDTMDMMYLKAVNNCSVHQETPSTMGMMQRAKDYITYGNLNQETFEKMLFKWGRINGDKKVTPEYLAEQKTTVKDLFEGKKKLTEVGIKQPFRLHPPRGGYKSTRKPVTLKGDLGFRGDKINDLLLKMI